MPPGSPSTFSSTPQVAETCTVHYSSGAVYSGQMKGGKRHGFGVLTSHYTYEGHWYEGKKQGQGKLTWANGNRYVGEFKDNMMHGEGSMIWEHCDGTVDSYQGEWRNGTLHGKGVKRMASDDVIMVGTWQDGLAHGWGTKTFANGDVHEGYYKNDKRNGYGTYTWADGDSYEGEWLNGKMHGRGIKTFRSGGGTYSGDWVNGMTHGCGVRIYPNGDRYEGWYEQDLRSQTGTYLWANGDRYHGEWVRGRVCGSGVKEMSNGDKYDGEWLDGVAHGFGIKYFANGDRHMGLYQKDVREGRGIYLYANGSEYDGPWKDNMQSGIGVCLYSNGDRFEGRWESGRKQGPGYHREREGGTTYLEIWSNGFRMHREELSEEQCKEMPSPQGLWLGTRTSEEISESRARAVRRTILKHGRARKMEDSPSIADIVDMWRWIWERSCSRSFWEERHLRRGIRGVESLPGTSFPPFPRDRSPNEASDESTSQPVEVEAAVLRMDVQNDAADTEVAMIEYDMEHREDSEEDPEQPAEVRVSPSAQQFHAHDPMDLRMEDSSQSKPSVRKRQPSVSSSSTESTTGGVRLTRRRRKKRIILARRESCISISQQATENQTSGLNTNAEGSPSLE